MLIYEGHYSTLQSALEIQNRNDGHVNFYCSDGKIRVKSTYLKLHSKLLSRIMADIPYDDSKVESSFSKHSREYTVSLPDVPKTELPKSKAKPKKVKEEDEMAELAAWAS